MPYDATKDGHHGTLLNFGTKARAVVNSDTVDIEPYPKAVMVLTSGTVRYLPLENADADYVQTEVLSSGTVLPHRVRRVFATGSTATLVTIDNK